MNCGKLLPASARFCRFCGAIQDIIVESASASASEKAELITPSARQFKDAPPAVVIDPATQTPDSSSLPSVSSSPSSALLPDSAYPPTQITSPQSQSQPSQSQSYQPQSTAYPQQSPSSIVIKRRQSSTPYIVIGGLLVLLVIAAVVAYFVVIATTSRHSALSDETLKVIQAVDDRGTPVDAVVFYSDTAPRPATRDQIEQLLKEYTSQSSKITYEFVDPFSSPARVTQLGPKSLDSVVFTDGKKKVWAYSITEADFTTALARLVDTSIKTVAFLQGHGERNPAGNTNNDYSSVDAILTQDYKVINWNLVTSPTLTLTDVTVLVIAAPQTALSAKESQTIQSYLDSGGHVLMEVDPTMPAAALKPMADILAKYGVTPVQGAVIDLATAGGTTGNKDPSVILASLPDNDITRALGSQGASVVFPLAMGLTTSTSTVGSMVVTSFVQSTSGSDHSWLETDLQSQSVQYNAGTDIPGPVTMGLTIEPQASGPNTPVNTKLVVFSDVDFASNYAVKQIPDNGDLFAKSVAWLAEANDFMSIRAKTTVAP
jgi:hypothetical protein